MSADLEHQAASEAPASPALPPRPPMVRRASTIVVLVGVYAVALRLADVDLGRLATGLPRMAGWAQKAWPPSTTGFDTLLLRAGETIAMALIGTTVAAILAVLTCTLAARNLTPSPWLRVPARFVLNTLRGIDSFVFALLFVAAVGLGPFAGVLGVALHTWGSMAKLYSEAIEAMPSGPLDAVALTGASKVKVVRYAMLPDVLPSLTSISLYMLEFNIRASTVLGIVGAGGIGQELKNAMDLLAFPRLLTIILVILVMVTAVDQLSARIRRRLA
jgi:phosphonate transport system permease protein